MALWSQGKTRKRVALEKQPKMRLQLWREHDRMRRSERDGLLRSHFTRDFLAWLPRLFFENFGSISYSRNWFPHWLHLQFCRNNVEYVQSGSQIKLSFLMPSGNFKTTPTHPDKSTLNVLHNCTRLVKLIFNFNRVIITFIFYKFKELFNSAHRGWIEGVQKPCTTQIIWLVSKSFWSKKDLTSIMTLIITPFLPPFLESWA